MTGRRGRLGQRGRARRSRRAGATRRRHDPGRRPSRVARVAVEPGRPDPTRTTRWPWPSGSGAVGTLRRARLLRRRASGRARRRRARLAAWRAAARAERDHGVPRLPRLPAADAGGRRGLDRARRQPAGGRPFARRRAPTPSRKAAVIALAPRPSPPRAATTASGSTTSCRASSTPRPTGPASPDADSTAGCAASAHRGRHGMAVQRRRAGRLAAPSSRSTGAPERRRRTRRVRPRRLPAAPAGQPGRRRRPAARRGPRPRRRPRGGRLARRPRRRRSWPSARATSCGPGSSLTQGADDRRRARHGRRARAGRLPHPRLLRRRPGRPSSSCEPAARPTRSSHAAGGGILATVRATRAAGHDELTEPRSTHLALDAGARARPRPRSSPGYGLDVESRDCACCAPSAPPGSSASQRVFADAARRCTRCRRRPRAPTPRCETCIDELLPEVVDVGPRHAPSTCSSSAAPSTSTRPAATSRPPASTAWPCGCTATSSPRSARCRWPSSSARAPSTTSRPPGPRASRRSRPRTSTGVLLPTAALDPAPARCRRRGRWSMPAAAIALATDFNPGSSFCESLPLGHEPGLHPDGPLAGRGPRRVHGQRAPTCWAGPSASGGCGPAYAADVVVLEAPDWRHLAYHMGAPRIRHVIVDGDWALGGAGHRPSDTPAGTVLPMATRKQQKRRAKRMVARALPEDPRSRPAEPRDDGRPETKPKAAVTTPAADAACRSRRSSARSSAARCSSSCIVTAWLYLLGDSKHRVSAPRRCRRCCQLFFIPFDYYLRDRFMYRKFARRGGAAQRPARPTRDRSRATYCSGERAQALDLAQRGQLAQRLDLDLPDPLARQAELAADLVEGARDRGRRGRSAARARGGCARAGGRARAAAPRGAAGPRPRRPGRWPRCRPGSPRTRTRRRRRWAPRGRSGSGRPSARRAPG